jgi:hypothetical protein
MKIINTSVAVRRPFDREHFVDLELLRLAKDLDIGSYPCDHDAPLKQKEELLEVLDIFAIDKQMQETTIRMVIQTPTTQKPNRPTDFKRFARLPPELRVRIWEMVMEHHLLPRIHCIEERNSRFLSNQPLSPLLHACHESRVCFLNSTQTTFAFGSYLNFSRDIIYIYDGNNPEGFLQRFLPSFDARLVQKLAIVKEEFAHLPLEGSPSTYHRKLREWLPNWREWIIVFEDYRSSEDCWVETEMVFKALSARYQRKRAEIGDARSTAKMYNTIWREPLEFRYVVFDVMETVVRRIACAIVK